MVKQRATKHTHKPKDLVTRTPLTSEVELGCSGKVEVPTMCIFCIKIRLDKAIIRNRRSYAIFFFIFWDQRATDYTCLKTEVERKVTIISLVEFIE